VNLTVIICTSLFRKILTKSAMTKFYHRTKFLTRCKLDESQKQERVSFRAFSYQKCKTSMTSPSLSRRLMIIQRTFAPTAAQHVEFRFSSRGPTRECLMRRIAPACLLQWFHCLERHALQCTYVQTLLHALVTLQNDHLLPQSYYR